MLVTDHTSKEQTAGAFGTISRFLLQRLVDPDYCYCDRHKSDDVKKELNNNIHFTHHVNYYLCSHRRNSKAVVLSNNGRFGGQLFKRIHLRK